MTRPSTRLELWVPAAYAAISAGWIALSDLVVARAAGSAEQQAAWSMLKGLGFVAVTAALLFAGLRWALRREREAHRQVLASEALLDAITRAIPNPVFLKDREGRWLFANPATLEAVGKTLEEVLNRTDREIYGDPRVGEALMDTDRRILAGGVAEVVEERIPTPTGERVFLSTKAPYRDRDGRVVGIIGNARDIADRKRAEEALRESETRYRLLFQNMLHGFAHCRMVYDDSGRPVDFVYLAVNAAFEALTGLKDVVGKRVSELIPGVREAEPELFETYGEVARSGRPARLEVNFHPLGMWLSVSVYCPSQDHFVAIFDNITSRRRADEALRESEERLRLFVEHAPAAVAMFDREMRYLAVSRRFVSDLRLKEQDLIGRSHYDIFPEMPDRWREVHRRCLAGAVEKCEEDPFPRPDGTVDWVRWEIRPWRDAGGEIGGVVLFSEIVTERKQAEEKLAAERERLAVTLQSIGDAVIATDESARIAVFNGVAEQLTGWKAQDALGRPLSDVFRVIAEDTREPVASPVERVLREGVVVNLANQTALLAKDGAERPIADSGAPIRDSSGRICGVVLVFRDQTEERRAERARRESEARYRVIFEQAAAGVAHVDAATGNFLQVNARFCEMLGYSRDEVLAGTWQRFTHPDDLEADRAGVLRMQASGEPYRCEKRYVRRDGSVVWAGVTVSPVALPGEKAKSQVAIVEDIGERRKAAVALEQRERDLRTILQTALDGYWLVDSLGRLVDVNEAYCEMSGYARDELLCLQIKDLEVSGTPQQTAAHMQRIIRQGLDRFETRHRCRDGRVLDIEASVKFVERAGSFVCFFRDITERKRADEALRRSEKRFRALIEKSTDMILVLDAEGRYQFWSESAAETLGWTPGEMLGRSALERVHPDDRPRIAHVLERLLSTESGIARELFRHQHADGSWRQLEGTARNLLRDPAVGGIVLNSRDVSEQRLLEEQFWQAQKLESVGRLAGGVAHDFNNLLTVILSSVEEMRDQPQGEAQPSAVLVEEIGAAGERARDLTRQLLAFARKQVIAPESLDLGAVVLGTEKLLRRLLGEDVELATGLGPGLWPVRCDRGQVEQVIVNLAVNARDAMPGGGTLLIETSNVEVDRDGVSAHPGMRPGSYVRLSVRDSGMGIAPEVKARIFEPFFTTKATGKGTGLGLATVYGIVKQSDGFISVESEPGRGTAFELLFPRAQGGVSEPGPRVSLARPQGRETVLVVEDDELVRGVTVRTLASAGYRVIVAGNGTEALDAAAREGGPVHLLVTDVIMPGLNGHELASELLRGRPDLCVLYVSGYAGDVISETGVLDSGVELLEKPFTAPTLLGRVRAILDARARSRAGAATRA